MQSSRNKKKRPRGASPRPVLRTHRRSCLCCTAEEERSREFGEEEGGESASWRLHHHLCLIISRSLKLQDNVQHSNGFQDWMKDVDIEEVTVSHLRQDEGEQREHPQDLSPIHISKKLNFGTRSDHETINLRKNPGRAFDIQNARHEECDTNLQGRGTCWINYTHCTHE